MLGAPSAIVGLLLLINVGAFPVSLPLVLGFLSIVGGILAVYLAFRRKTWHCRDIIAYRRGRPLTGRITYR